MLWFVVVMKLVQDATHLVGECICMLLFTLLIIWERPPPHWGSGVEHLCKHNADGGRPFPNDEKCKEKLYICTHLGDVWHPVLVSQPQQTTAHEQLMSGACD